MTLARGISSIEVTMEDGSKEVYSSEDWTMYKTKDVSPIAKDKATDPQVLVESHAVHASRRVDG